jgi:hypothetical protein
LIPQLLAEDGWDEMHVWMNTNNHDDLVFLSQLPKLDSRIKLQFLDCLAKTHVADGYYQQSRVAGNLGEWWPKHCTDPDAIYVRFDDDIVFVEPGTVQALVQARLEYPDPYLIFPTIINNGIMAFFLEEEGKLKNPTYKSYSPYVFDPLIWSADLCFDIHDQFLKGAVKHGVEHFHMRNREIAPQHISINCMTYFGKDIASWGGKFDHNGEEGFITCQVPYWARRNLMVLGSKVVSHFAFSPQRAHWEGNTSDEDVKMYVGQKQTLEQATPELEHKFNTDAEFREQVVKRVNCWNRSLDILENYRNLCLNLYNIYSYPIAHDTWDWAELDQQIQQFQQTKRKETSSTISSVNSI